MELAMHNWMRREPVEEALARMARLGYQSVEISGEPERYDVRAVRQLLNNYGLRCWGSVTLMVQGRSVIAADEAVREASVEYVKDCITLSKELGGEILSFVPAEVGKLTPSAGREEEWRWLVQSTTEIVDHAERSGIRVGVEPLNRFESYIINRADQALALCDAVGPQLGVALDTFHMGIEEEDMLDAIRRVGDRIVDVHVTDNNRMPCGMGSMDWSAIVNQLAAVGYNGALAAEFIPTVDRTPADRYPQSIDDSSPKGLTHSFREDHYSQLMSQNIAVLSPIVAEFETSRKLQLSKNEH